MKKNNVILRGMHQKLNDLMKIAQFTALCSVETDFGNTNGGAENI
jgi:hypothetical protein